jgi:opacity protein-like surface antigen
MTRWMAVLLTAVAIGTAERAHAQDMTSGPGTVEVTVIPGGGTFFTSGDKGPSFGNYTLGGALTYNINRVVGIEGEVGGTLGVSQDLQLGGVTSSQKTPNLLNYAANLVVSAPTRTGVVPYVTGGVGGLTMYERAELGVNDTTTFVTGNVGGGLKWYAPNGRWGVRGDYRFIVVGSKDDAPAFFGTETRFGHRVYGALVINAVR